MSDSANHKHIYTQRPLQGHRLAIGVPTVPAVPTVTIDGPAAVAVPEGVEKVFTWIRGFG